MSSEVDRVIQKKQTWFGNAYGSGLTGDECIDILHHDSSFTRLKKYMISKAEKT